MNKRICAALLAMLMGGLSCPAALADSPPELPADSGYIEEQPSAETPSESGTTEQTPPEPPDALPPEQPPDELPLKDLPPEDPPSEDPPPEDPPPEDLPPENLPPEDDGCDTIEELAEQMARDVGGTVAVTGDLTLPQGASVWLEAQQPVTIDLGSHGITVPEGATLTLSGPITLTGDGAPNPLLTVSGFLTTENGAALRAFGERALAVRLTGGDWNTHRALVAAEGADACGVESDGPLDLYRTQLSAKGQGAVCVRASAPVRLTLCRAESQGALADVPALTLDGSAATPEPEDARIIRRVAVPHDYYETNGLWIEAGAPQEELDALLTSHLDSNRFEYGLSDQAQQEEDLLYITAMTWTGDGVDLDVPGVYWLTGEPEDWDLGGVIPLKKRVPVMVADPALPAIREGYQMDGSVRLAFFRPIQGAERLTLWYSADLGNSWQDAGALPGVEITPEGASLPALPEPNRDYLFRLEVEGGPMEGRSNTLRCLYYDNQWGGGGDWDGGDWGDQGPLPNDDPAPPPDREPAHDPSPEPGDTPSQPDRGEGGDDSDNGSQPEERPMRPDPPAILTPAPMPGLPDIKAFFVKPVPTPQPTPAPIPQEAVPLAELDLPTSAPAPISEPPQPAPTPSALPEGATVSLTGRDLEAQKLANPGGVTLAGDGLKVTLPYTLTDALGLGPADMLAVRLAMPDPTSFEVRLWADGQEVADFGGGVFTVSVPVEAGEGTEYRCVAPDGREIAASAMVGKWAEFELTATGDYTLSTTQASAPAPAKRDVRPILPLTLGAVALMGVCLLAWRRRGAR